MNSRRHIGPPEQEKEVKDTLETTEFQIEEEEEKLVKQMMQEHPRGHSSTSFPAVTQSRKHSRGEADVKSSPGRTGSSSFQTLSEGFTCFKKKLCVENVAKH